MREAVKVKPGLPWRSQDVRDESVMEYLQRRTLTGSGTSPREGSVLLSTKPNGFGDVERILTLDMEMHSWEFVQLVFSLAVVQYFLAMLPPLNFGRVIYTLCHYMLKVCDLLFDFDSMEDYS